ncbi:MAG: class I SAM-dependent methyltransferase [Armatimonadota bacterium]
MNWRVKALTQKTLSVLPGGERMHSLLQRRCGGLSHFEGECSSKIQDWKNMALLLRQAGVPLEGSRLLEIGTGWYPTLPFCCAAAGAAEVLTIDLNRYLDPELTRRCAELVEEQLEEIAACAGRSLPTTRGDWQRVAELVRSGRALESKAGARLRYLAPGDATRTGLPADSLDVVFSNSVLEHVPPRVIEGMMRESFRILRPGGVVFHSVNCGDHYSYFDSSVTQLNYLRYSDRQWSLWNNAFLYQNRLRAVDFVRMAREHGFEVEIDTSHPTPQRQQELRHVPVARRFRDYSPDDLCITTIDFVARKPGRQEAGGVE